MYDFQTYPLQLAADYLADRLTDNRFSAEFVRALVMNGELLAAVYPAGGNLPFYIDGSAASNFEATGQPEIGAWTLDELRENDLYSPGSDTRYRPGIEIPLSELERFVEVERAKGSERYPIQVSVEAANWHLNKPQRAQGYNMELYFFLKSQRDLGMPKPKVAEVLSAWHESPPQGITVTKKLRGFTGIQYQAGGKQCERTADSEAITKAILRMTTPPTSTKSGKGKSSN